MIKDGAKLIVLLTFAAVISGRRAQHPEERSINLLAIQSLENFDDLAGAVSLLDKLMEEYQAVELELKRRLSEKLKTAS